MGRLVESNKTHLEAIDPEAIINPLLLNLSNKAGSNDIETFKLRELDLWIIR